MSLRLVVGVATNEPKRGKMKQRVGVKIKHNSHTSEKKKKKHPPGGVGAHNRFQVPREGTKSPLDGVIMGVGFVFLWFPKKPTPTPTRPQKKNTQISHEPKWKKMWVETPPKKTQREKGRKRRKGKFWTMFCEFPQIKYPSQKGGGWGLPSKHTPKKTPTQKKK